MQTLTLNWVCTNETKFWDFIVKAPKKFKETAGIQIQIVSESTQNTARITALLPPQPRLPPPNNANNQTQNDDDVMSENEESLEDETIGENTLLDNQAQLRDPNISDDYDLSINDGAGELASNPGKAVDEEATTTEIIKDGHSPSNSNDGGKSTSHLATAVNGKAASNASTDQQGPRFNEGQDSRDENDEDDDATLVATTSHATSVQFEDVKTSVVKAKALLEVRRSSRLNQNLKGSGHKTKVEHVFRKLIN